MARHSDASGGYTNSDVFDEEDEDSDSEHENGVRGHLELADGAARPQGSGDRQSHRRGYELRLPTHSANAFPETRDAIRFPVR